jgi:iron complex transport system substrate-binding protein
MKRKSLRLISMLLVLMMIFSFSGCGNTAASGTAAEDEIKTVTNLDGTEITVPANVEKVGAIFGPSYEKIVMLGAEDKIVFDGDFHIGGWPWSNVIYKNLNDVPGIPNAHSELNIEDLLKYEPDVVFNFSNPETTGALEEAGICVVPMASTGKLSDIKDTVALYAEVLGGDAAEISDRYSEYYDGMVEKISAVTKDIPAADRPKVYIANQNILWTSGKNSDLNEMIELAGGDPVAKDLEGGGKTEITKEQFIQWNPDYVFVDHAGSSGNATAEQVIDEMLADADFSGVSAVANDQVIIVPTGVFFWDAGVQKPLFALLIAKTLYPDKFADVDMKAELRSFYSEFFHYDLTDDEADRILAHLDPA